MWKCNPSQSVARCDLPAPKVSLARLAKANLTAVYITVLRIHLLLWPYLKSSDCAGLRACCHRFEQGSPQKFHSTEQLLYMLESGKVEDQIRACKCLAKCKSHLGNVHKRIKAAAKEMQRQMDEKLIILDKKEGKLVKKATWKVRYWARPEFGRFLVDLGLVRLESWVNRCLMLEFGNKKGEGTPRCSDDSTSLFGWLVRFCAVCVLFSAAWTVDVWSGIRKRLHGHGADNPHYRWGANRALRLLRLRTFFADFGCHPLFMRNQMAESAKAAEVSQKSNSSKGSRLGSNEKLKRTTMRQQKGRNHKCSNQLDQWPTWWDVQHYKWEGHQNYNAVLWKKSGAICIEGWAVSSLNGIAGLRRWS